MPADLRLSEFQQTVQLVCDDQTYRVIQFPGVSPVVVHSDPAPLIYQQTGQAKAFGAKFVPPGPLEIPPDGYLLEPPTISYRRDDDGLHWWTSWSYTFVVNGGIDEADIIDLCKWPTTPTFVTF